MSKPVCPTNLLRFAVPLLLVSLIGTGVLAATSSDQATQRMVESSVVKVMVHSSPPDLLSPWQKEGTETASGSGVLIDGNRILTNAHVVEDAINVEVKRAGVTEQFVAQVSFIAQDARRMFPCHRGHQPRHLYR